jgi:addiction module HigA family antidote
MKTGPDKYRVKTAFLSTMYDPARPGEVLKDFLGERSIAAVANHLGVSRVALSRVLNCRARVSPEMSIRLGEALGTTPDLWFNMQARYDFWIASQKKRKRVKPLPRVQGNRDKS